MPSAFNPEEIRKALAEKLSERLDLHSTFQWEHFLEQGVDAHFICRTIGLDGAQGLAKASDYWKQVDYKSPFEGVLTLPRDRGIVGLYSRRAFIHPQLTAWVKLPYLSPVGNETIMMYFLGFENGSEYFNGIASFCLTTSPSLGSNILRVAVGPLGGYIFLSINAVKPADFNTAYHVYRVVSARDMVFFIIDDRIRCVAVKCLQGGYVKVKENTPPYSIVLTPPMSSSLTALIEINTNRSLEAPSDFAVPISPYCFRVSDGEETIPLSLPLYLENSDTALAGYSISSGSVTSHPIPVFGYRDKTLFLQASQSGSVSIEVYTLAGNWRTYDSDTVSANTLWRYKMTGDAVLARLTFTPTTYPCTVSDAGVSLVA
jgi:hypothetical protein